MTDMTRDFHGEKGKSNRRVIIAGILGSLVKKGSNQRVMLAIESLSEIVREEEEKPFLRVLTAGLRS